MYASENGHIEVVRTLLESGANINAQTNVMNHYDYDDNYYEGKVRNQMMMMIIVIKLLTILMMLLMMIVIDVFMLIIDNYDDSK